MTAVKRSMQERKSCEHNNENTKARLDERRMMYWTYDVWQQKCKIETVTGCMIGCTYSLWRDDVFPLVLVEPSDSLHRDVVTLRCSACEHNLLWVGFYQLRHLLQYVQIYQLTGRALSGAHEPPTKARIQKLVPYGDWRSTCNIAPTYLQSTRAWHLP